MRQPNGLIQDARYAVRNFSRDPFLTVTGTLTLAICIGANTTVFSVANSILTRPLPYPRADRIDWIADRTGPAKKTSPRRPNISCCANRIVSSKTLARSARLM